MNNKLFCRTMLRKICLVAAFGISSLALFAQGTKISGTVTDTNGSSLPGVNVTVKGTTQGTVTDENGRYNLPVPSEESTLQFTFVGYTTQEIVVGNRQIIDVQMSEGVELEEVMVVAYGTTTKASFTGSASVIKSDQIQKISAVNAVEGLQGMTAGVNITNNEGSPGRDARIQIRGIGTFRDAAASNPLYVVDGVPYDGKLNTIAPSDIESMTVLKDAAASALYGSRAANGVVVITTKKGKSGKPTVNLRAAWGTSDNAVKNPTKADPYQTLLYTWEGNFNDAKYIHGMSDADAAVKASSFGPSQHVTARINAKGETVYVSPFMNAPLDQYVLFDGSYQPYVNPNLKMVWEPSDWDVYDAFYEHKLRQDYGMDVSGSTDSGKTNYFFSASHLNDYGYGLAQYYKRYSFRANAASQINNWLRLGGSLAYTYGRQAANGSNRMLVFTNTLNSPWLRNVENTDWEYSLKTGNRMTDYDTNIKEPFGIQALAGMQGQGDYWDNPDDFNFNNDEDGMMTAHWFAELTLPFGIKYKMNVNYGDIIRTHYRYNSAVHDYGQKAPYGITVLTNGGSAQRETTKTASLTWNNILSWDKSLGNHNFGLMAGHEFYNRNITYASTYGEGIMEIGRYEVANTTKGWSGNSYHDKYALLSVFGQLQYNFNHKYYISGSVRTDGSSRFSADERWGTFFSVGGSWRISQESFMQDISWLNNLSLRVSYGATGNDNIGTYYAYQSYYDSYNLYDQPGMRKSTNGAPTLHWEENKQFNVGLDFSVFDRFSGTVEYYHRRSDGLLATKSLPFSANAGAATINTNLGDILNEGIEVSLNVAVMHQNDFHWDINANLTTLHNEILKLPGGAYLENLFRTYYKKEEGHAVFEHFIPKTAGVDPEDGRLQYVVKDKDGNWTTSKSVGAIQASRDGQYVGSPIPKGYGSITNSFKYKDFDFSFMFYGSWGSRIYSYQLLENYSLRGGVSPVPDIVDGVRWQKPGDVKQFPRWSMEDRTLAGQNTNCDLWILNNSFLRLRNVTLGYTLPKNFLNKIGVSNVRVYVTGDNLLTFSPIKKYYIDPEQGLWGNDYNGNAEDDSGIQGSRRIFMGGIQVTF